MSEISEKLDLLLVKTTRIEAALWPDGPYQPTVLTDLKHRVHTLENWRNYLMGAWGIVVTFFTLRKFWGH